MSKDIILWIDFLKEYGGNYKWTALCEVITEKDVDLIPKLCIDGLSIMNNKNLNTETKKRVLNDSYESYYNLVNNLNNPSFQLEYYFNMPKYHHRTILFEPHQPTGFATMYGNDPIYELRCYGIYDIEHDLLFDEVKYYRKVYPHWSRLESEYLTRYYFTKQRNIIKHKNKLNINFSELKYILA